MYDQLNSSRPTLYCSIFVFVITYTCAVCFLFSGTIRENRLDRCPLPKSATFKKESCGAIDVAGDGDVVISVWNDNKPIYVASNHEGVNPTVKKRRYSRTQRSHIQVDCPQMIHGYNSRMGGVDLFDRFLSDYRPSIKGKKWWFVFYTHALNVCLVAAWRIHCEVGGSMQQLHFRRHVVRTLLQIQASSRAQSPAVVRSVLPDIRFDGVGHSLQKISEGRCRACQKNTTYKCGKCNQRLHQKCFAEYHIRK